MGNGSTQLAYLLLGGLTVAFSVFVASASTTSDGAISADRGVGYDGAIGADAGGGDDDLIVNALAGILPGVIIAARSARRRSATSTAAG